MKSFAGYSFSRPTDLLGPSRHDQESAQRRAAHQQSPLAPLLTASSAPAGRAQPEENFQRAFHSSRSSGLPAPLKSGLVQTKSAVVGPAGDAFEQEADRVADEVTKSSASGPVKRPPQLLHGPGGVLRRNAKAHSASGSNLQAQLGESGGGSSLPTNVLQNFESKFGADFSGVRVHTGDHAATMNSSLQSRAFTTGQDIYFGKGEYRPDTQEGQKVLAHELTHVGQQNPALMSKPLLHDQANVIRPLRANPRDQHYYSDASPGLHNEYMAANTNDAFLTATSNDGPGGGHTTIYLEYFDPTNNAPINKRVELFLGQRWGTINISIKDYTSEKMQEYLATAGSGYKKTWKKTRANAQAALAAATNIQTNQANYSYWKLGKGLPFTNNNMNCARFGQRVLQAGGVDLHIKTLKLPSRITDPATDNGAIANVYTTAHLNTTARSQLPTYCRDARQFLTASQVTDDDTNAGSLALAAGSLKKYHMFEETLQRTPHFVSAIDQLVTYAKGAASAEFVARRGNPTATANPTLAWLRTTLYDALRREGLRLGLELRSDIAELQQAGLPVTELSALVPKIHASMSKLATLMRFTSSDAMVRARVTANYTDSSGHSLNSKINQILRMAEANVLPNHFAP